MKLQNSRNHRNGDVSVRLTSAEYESFLEFWPKIKEKPAKKPQKQEEFQESISDAVEVKLNILRKKCSNCFFFGVPGNENGCSLGNKPDSFTLNCQDWEMKPHPRCRVCDGQGFFFGGERGEKMEDCVFDCQDAYEEFGDP